MDMTKPSGLYIYRERKTNVGHDPLQGHGDCRCSLSRGKLVAHIYIYICIYVYTYYIIGHEEIIGNKFDIPNEKLDIEVMAHGAYVSPFLLYQTPATRVFRRRSRANVWVVA